MASEMNLCPAEIDLCFTRGDSTPWTFTIKDSSGSAVNITGYSFLLTVDPSATPVDDIANLFQLVGTIIDGPNGIVQFQMSTAQSNQTPADYYFDLQQTDGSSNIRTIAKGKFTISQDITK